MEEVKENLRSLVSRQRATVKEDTINPEKPTGEFLAFGAGKRGRG